MPNVRLKKRLFWSFLAASLLGLGVWAVSVSRDAGVAHVEAVDGSAPRLESTSAHYIAVMNARLSHKDFRDAKAFTQQAIAAFPDDMAVLEAAGDLLWASGQTADAIHCFQRALLEYGYAKMASSFSAPNAYQVESGNKAPEALFVKYGHALMADYRPCETLEVLRRAVVAYPKSLEVRRGLSGLLLSLGYDDEAYSHLQWILSRGHVTAGELMVMGDPTRPQVNEALCQMVLRRHPEDVRPQYGLAVLDAHYDRWGSVVERLQPVVDESKRDGAAFALLGRAMIEQGQLTEWSKLSNLFPQEVEQCRHYWLGLGALYARKKQPDDAVQSYLRALRLNPFDAEALIRLSDLLVDGDSTSELRNVCVRRVGEMDHLRKLLDALSLSQTRTGQELIAIAECMSEMGRYWEAVFWTKLALEVPGEHRTEAESLQKHCYLALTRDAAWFSVKARELLTSDVPLNPQWEPQFQKINSRQDSHASSIRADYRFSDEAERRGIRHTCRINKPDGEESDLAIYQSGVGGSAAIDFDLDGWADVYLSSSDGEPMQNNSSPNALFRNLNGRFLQVSEQAQVIDTGFAQGFGVGDIDNDGFPDLYVANIGSNHLYRNNGDGTFHEVASDLGISGERWTTSVALADIDGDGHTDIYDVCYCAGGEPFSVKCTRDGQTRSCSPLMFKGEKDRVWQGLSDGKFRDVSQQWLTNQEGRCGLALVVGTLDDQTGLDIYVANDMAANSFWSRRSDAGAALVMHDEAVVRGVALSDRSQAQASMGIALGDADNDGDSDLFVTNHANEPNAFYEQLSPGIWSDRSQQAGLKEVSLPMLGFGTQMIDIDNNAQLELLVANGHVDDFTHLGDAFRMPMQCFGRSDEGRWSLMDPETLGPYFKEKKLGRSMTLLDANCDGRKDVLVTHLFDPVSLLVNQTPTFSLKIVFRLQGTDCQRDAIGAKIQIEFGGMTRWQQLTSGDGYQCANEKSLDFGVGSAAYVDKATVFWPNGRQETHYKLESQREYLLVEGENPTTLRILGDQAD